MTSISPRSSGFLRAQDKQQFSSPEPEQATNVESFNSFDFNPSPAASQGSNPSPLQQGHGQSSGGAGPTFFVSQNSASGPSVSYPIQIQQGQTTSFGLGPPQQGQFVNSMIPGSAIFYPICGPQGQAGALGISGSPLSRCGPQNFCPGPSTFNSSCSQQGQAGNPGLSGQSPFILDLSRPMQGQAESSEIAGLPPSYFDGRSPHQFDFGRLPQCQAEYACIPPVDFHNVSKHVSMYPQFIDKSSTALTSAMLPNMYDPSHPQQSQDYCTRDIGSPVDSREVSPCLTDYSQFIDNSSSTPINTMLPTRYNSDRSTQVQTESARTSSSMNTYGFSLSLSNSPQAESSTIPTRAMFREMYDPRYSRQAQTDSSRVCSSMNTDVLPTRPQNSPQSIDESSTTPVSAIFPEMYKDEDNHPSSWNSMLPIIGSFNNEPDAMSESLGSYDSLASTTDTEASSVTDTFAFEDPQSSSTSPVSSGLPGGYPPGASI